MAKVHVQATSSHWPALGLPTVLVSVCPAWSTFSRQPCSCPVQPICQPSPCKPPLPFNHYLWPAVWTQRGAQLRICCISTLAAAADQAWSGISPAALANSWGRSSCLSQCKPDALPLKRWMFSSSAAASFRSACLPQWSRTAVTSRASLWHCSLSSPLRLRGMSAVDAGAVGTLCCMRYHCKVGPHCQWPTCREVWLPQSHVSATGAAHLELKRPPTRRRHSPVP